MPLARLGKQCGSSPLARGLHVTVRGRNLVNGIIPARAGFTNAPEEYDSLKGDHPRSRGVYWRRLACRLSLLWIIPARAGFTADAGLDEKYARDHPRSRGVYFICPMALWMISGSSPLARGLRGVRLRGLDGGGIIPARAGFTEPCRRRHPVRRDHPRSRGVYSCAVSVAPG